MSEKISLKEAERRAFRFKLADGLWDVFIGCFVLLFALAPLLSESLGDFWSSVIFLPFWALVYLAIRLARTHVVTPRLGEVTFGGARKKKLARVSRIMLFANGLIVILGIVVMLLAESSAGSRLAGIFGLLPTALGLFCLLGFSVAASVLDYPRFYFYGLLLFAAPIAGEWLSQTYGTTHHGWPVTFGAASAIIILSGLVTFLSMVLKNPPIETPVEGI